MADDQTATFAPTGREIACVVVLLVLALALRVGFVYQLSTSPYFARQTPQGPAVDFGQLTHGTDMERYDQTARGVLQDGWWSDKSADASPLYPYALLPLLYLITHSSIFWSLVLQSVLDTGTVFLIYLLARRLYGTRAALYAGLGAATYAPFIIYQGQLLGESLLNFCIAVFFVVLLGARGVITVRRALATGALLGLATAAKPTCVVFAPLALVFVLAQCRWKMKTSLARTALSAAAFLAVLVPFAYRNYRAAGEFHLVRGNSGIMLYMGNNPEATGAYRQPSGETAERLAAESARMTLAERDAFYRTAALDYVQSNPAGFLRLLWAKFRLFFEARDVSNNISAELFRQTTFLEAKAFPTFALVLPFAVAGFAFSLKARNVPFVLGQILVYSLTIIFFVVVGRYRLAIVPLLLPAAGFAASRIVYAIKSLDLAATAAYAVPIAIAAALVSSFDLTNFVNQRLHPNGFVSGAGPGIVIHDDSNYATPFGVYTLTAESKIAKVLVVKEPLAGLKAAGVLIQLMTTQPGVLTVTLNGADQRAQAAVLAKHWLRVDFPPDAVRQGVNTIYVRGDGRTETFVYADDVNSFGRSAYTPNGLQWLDDNFDQVTWRSQPSLHMGGHEFKIRLALDYSQAPAPP